jgi:hypothetical protein
MFVVYYHNELVYDNHSQCETYGPLTDLDAAKECLAKLVKQIHDEDKYVASPMFKIDESGIYAGFDSDELDADGIDTDIADEIWAEIVPLRQFSNEP